MHIDTPATATVTTEVFFMALLKATLTMKTSGISKIAPPMAPKDNGARMTPRCAMQALLTNFPNS